jgi:hypothetical protein
MAFDKKKFMETGFGKFCKKAANVVPDVLDVVLEVASGDIKGAVEKVRTKIGSAALRDEKAKELMYEFQLAEFAFQKEMEELAVRDRESARLREMEYVKAGRIDWEHILLAVIGISAFCFLLVVLVYKQLPAENRELFIHVAGIIEGVVFGIYNYNFGSTRSSRNKDQIIANNSSK